MVVESGRNQENKILVWNYWQSLATRSTRSSIEQHLHPNVIWHGFQPLRNLHGTQDIWSQFWQPLLSAFPDLIRRPYLFICGIFEGNAWVCGTGDFIGTFASDWEMNSIKIPASGTTIHFRFGEFCKLEKGKITEIRILIDLPDLLRQSNVTLMPPNYGRDIWIPGPLAGDGVCLAEQDPTESQKTYSLVTEMIFGGLNKYDGQNQDSQGLERFWHRHMAWHGPVGIGSTYGLEEFKKNAQGPIVHAFPDRRGVGHQARIAEGRFAASTGWPSLGGTHKNRYMGWPATNKRAGWNIMDFWKREGDLLRENWVMIDLIGAAMESDIDLLACLR